MSTSQLGRPADSVASVTTGADHAAKTTNAAQALSARVVSFHGADDVGRRVASPRGAAGLSRDASRRTQSRGAGILAAGEACSRDRRGESPRAPRRGERETGCDQEGDRSGSGADQRRPVGPGSPSTHGEKGDACRTAGDSVRGTPATLFRDNRTASGRIALGRDGDRGRGDRDNARGPGSCVAPDQDIPSRRSYDGAAVAAGRRASVFPEVARLQSRTDDERGLRRAPRSQAGLQIDRGLWAIQSTQKPSSFWRTKGKKHTRAFAPRHWVEIQEATLFPSRGSALGEWRRAEACGGSGVAKIVRVFVSYVVEEDPS